MNDSKGAAGDFALQCDSSPIQSSYSIRITLKLRSVANSVWLSNLLFGLFINFLFIIKENAWKFFSRNLSLFGVYLLVIVINFQAFCSTDNDDPFKRVW